ncbi:MAG: NfeD family protein [Armatimonadota bacterium]
MFLVYTVSAIVAGVMVLLSLFGADHGSDHEVHVELHHDGADHDSGQGHWLPFFSLRFYTYFFAGFGTTGLLLTLLTKTTPIAIGWIAAVVGLVAGLAVSIVVRLLKLSETTTSSKDNDVLGKEAEVLVAIRGTVPGRIRCSVKGDLIDFLAVTEEGQDIEAGTPVVVVLMENGRAHVARRDAIFGGDAPQLGSL